MSVTDAELADLYRNLQSYRLVGEAAGLHNTTVLRRLRRSGAIVEKDEDAGKPLHGGRVGAHEPDYRPLPPPGRVSRYICTSAQNNTVIHPQALAALETVAAYYDAEILVSSFTYNRNAWAKSEEKTGADRSTMAIQTTDGNPDWYAPGVRDYLDEGNKDIALAPTLMWVGRANILPTSPKPLNGFDTYTGEASCIVPHTRQHLRSVPTMKNKPAKFLYSTGTVTQRNYIERTTGLKADFHHTYGALLIEVRDDGSWFVRQLNVDSDGAVYDLDMAFDADGGVFAHDGIEALHPGDLHSAQLADETLSALATDDNCMIDTLRPRYVFGHDVLDFRARNHHERSNPHQMFFRFHHGEDNVAAEIGNAAAMLGLFCRPWLEVVVVDSNHDQALTRWLREADYRNDPANAIFFLEAQLAMYRAIRDGNDHHVLEWAFNRSGTKRNFRFLREDESFVVCPDIGGGIECGMHGHLGPNGSRGNATNLSKLDTKSSVGHYHSAAIVDGLFAAGVSGKLDMGYNHGPSSWSWSHIVTYPNGKRAIVTQVGRDWRA